LNLFTLDTNTVLPRLAETAAIRLGVFSPSEFSLDSRDDYT